MVKNIKNNNKGFTLIELLAVVVIMGVLMIVAIPAVTKYIERSRKDAYVDTAKAYINSARYMLLNDEFDCDIPTVSGTGGDPTKGDPTIYIKLADVEIDQGGGKSPYNKEIDTANSYVRVEPDGTATAPKSKYSIAIIDKGSSRNGTIGFVAEKDFTRVDIKKGSAVAGTLPNEAKLCAKRS